MQELIKYHNDKLKNRIFDKIFVNVHFSITVAYKDFNFSLLSPHTHSEGTVSQSFYLGLSFYSLSQNGKHFPTF